MSNEKRLQQIRDAARYKYPDERIHFIDGAKWADSNPAWVSVEDELPAHRNQTNHKFENDFSVNCFVSDGKDVDTGYYDYRLRKWNCEFLTDDVVVYWYCPQPPRKEANNETRRIDD